MAGWGMGQREPGGGCLHHLQVGRQRQFPAPRVHRQDPGQARDERLAEDRLGPGQAPVQVVGRDSGKRRVLVVKAEGVQQNGEPASATNIITRLGKDRIGWQSVNRTLGGAAVPGVVEFTLVRKPPEVGK